MSSLPAIELELREKSGKGAARAVRRNGYVPGTLYGQEKPESIQVKQSELVKEMQKPGLFTRVFSVNGLGKPFQALIRAVERDLISELPTHFDLQKIEDSTKLKLSVPLKFINREKCPGLKRGGVLSVIHHSIQVKCLAKKIVDCITIDLDGAPVGKSIRFSDLQLPEGMAFLNQRMQDTVYTIVPPKVKGKDAAAEADDGAESSSEDAA